MLYKTNIILLVGLNEYEEEQNIKEDENIENDLKEEDEYDPMDDF